MHRWWHISAKDHLFKTYKDDIGIESNLFLYPLFFQTSRVVQLAIRPRRPRLRDLGQGPYQLARPLSTSCSQNPATRWNSSSWCHDEGPTGSGHGQTSGRRWAGNWPICHGIHWSSQASTSRLSIHFSHCFVFWKYLFWFA